MVIGAVLIVAGGLLLGLAWAGELAGQARATADAMAEIRALEREICGRLAPLPEALQAARQDGGSVLLGAFAEKLEEFGSERAAESWHAAVKTSRLSAEAARLTDSLASVIGRYSGEEQRTAFQETLARLAELWEDQRKESRTLGRLAVAFGGCGGALTAILLL